MCRLCKQIRVGPEYVSRIHQRQRFGCFGVHNSAQEDDVVAAVERSVEFACHPGRDIGKSGEIAIPCPRGTDKLVRTTLRKALRDVLLMSGKDIHSEATRLTDMGE